VLNGSLNAFDFPYQDFHYFVSIVELTNSLVPLNPAACTAAGSATPCIGFITAENAETEAQFGFLITSRPIRLVPEPGVLPLLAFALFALTWTSRRRKG
jgi:hypothetical protein